MPLPHTFGPLAGPIPASFLDDNFLAVAAMAPTPCTASGNNTIALTPVGAVPTVTGYVALAAFKWVQPSDNTTAVTINVAALGAVALLHQDGSACVAGDLQGGAVIQAAYDGIGSFYLITPVGALQAASSTGFRNWLINGSFIAQQRGAGNSLSISVAASSTAYTFDRWYIITGANQASVISSQPGITTGSRFCAQIQRTAGQTGTTKDPFAQPLDTDVIMAVRGQTCTLSLFAKAGANWSPASGTLSWIAYCGTGAVAKRGNTGYTGESSPITGSINLTPGGAVSAQQSSSGLIPANTTQMEVQFFWTPVGTAGANDWVQLADVQLEIAGTATTFDILRRNLPFELGQCQRFYQKTFPYATAPAQNAGTTGVVSRVIDFSGSTKYSLTWNFITRMRGTPAIVTFNPSAANSFMRDMTAGADVGTGITPAFTNDLSSLLQLTAAATPAVGAALGIHATADAEI